MCCCCIKSYIYPIRKHFSHRLFIILHFSPLLISTSQLNYIPLLYLVCFNRPRTASCQTQSYNNDLQGELFWQSKSVIDSAEASRSSFPSPSGCFSFSQPSDSFCSWHLTVDPAFTLPLDHPHPLALSQQFSQPDQSLSSLFLQWLYQSGCLCFLDHSLCSCLPLCIACFRFWPVSVYLFELLHYVFVPLPEWSWLWTLEQVVLCFSCLSLQIVFCLLANLFLH